MPRKHVRQRAVLAAMVVLLGTTNVAQAGGQKLRIMMNWQAQAEQCGFYQAMAKGYYGAAGVDVSLLNGGPDINEGLLLASGSTDFILADAVEVLTLHARGIPVVATAAFFQKDPQTIAAHPDPAIRVPADLRGHPIFIANASRNRFWLWAKARFGLSDQQLRPYSFTGLPFLLDPTSAQQGYITNDGYVIGKTLGKTPVSFLLADYGYQNYADVLATTRTLMEADPKAVQAVVDASRRGWEECVHGDAGPAWQAIHQANPNYPKALFDYSLVRMRDQALVTGSPAVPVGSMTDGRWAAFLASMKQLGVVPAGGDYEGAYTLRFSTR